MVKMKQNNYNGILIINKEKGFTSFDVVAKLRGILKQKKIGHTGTLDPDATGVLVVLLGQATKLSELLSSDTKVYTVGMRLGMTSDTDDISGNVNESEHNPLSDMDSSNRSILIEETVKSFVCEYMQLPPMYAAIKVNGRKLYEYARAGVEVERTPRKIRIFDISDIAVDYPDVSFNVYCSKGTYIRSICRDIGEKLESGGLMTFLRRDVTGDFSIKDAFTLSEVESLVADGTFEEKIIPINDFLKDYPEYHIKPDCSKFLLNGNKLGYDSFTQDYEKKDKYIRVLCDDELVALYEDTGSALKPCKMFS